MRAKILFLSFRFPYPEWKGGFNLRVFRLAKFLAENYDVSLLSLYEKEEEKKYLSQLKKENIFKEIFLFYHPPLKEYFQTFKGLFSNFPLQVSFYFSKRLLSFLKKIYQKYDFFYFNTLRTVEWQKVIGKKPAVLDLIDAVSLNYSRQIKYQNLFWKTILKIELPRVKEYEKKILKNQTFLRYFITSPEDKEYLEKLCQKKIENLVWIPNGVREDIFSIKNFPEENWIAFFGKMDTQPNQDAVFFFSKKVFPLLKRKYKDLKFLIIGTNPTKKVRALEKIKGIKVTGFVKNPYFLLKKTKLLVFPLRFGTGVQNKLLEGMALGKTCLIPSFCQKALPQAKNKVHFVVISSFKEKEWQKEIERLLFDKNEREKIGKEAKSFVENFYKWDKIKKVFLKEIELCLKKK